MVSTLEQMQVPNGTGPGVRRSKRPLLASRTRCNVPWKRQITGLVLNVSFWPEPEHKMAFVYARKDDVAAASF